MSIYISESELKDALYNYNYPVPVKVVDAIWVICDIDKNNKISKKEFENLCVFLNA